MENQPNKPLTNLPEHFVKGINKAVQVDTNGASSPLEKIMEDRKLEASKVEQKVPTPLKVDEYVLYPDVMVMILYALTKLAKTDKHLDEVLKQFAFTLKDATGTQIYPITKSKTKKVTNGTSK